jgi:hypothetical protein
MALLVQLKGCGGNMKKLLITAFILSQFITTSAFPLSFSKNDVGLRQIRLIARMIRVVQPDLTDTNRNRIASSLYSATKKYKIDPKLMIAIIGTESDFVNSKVSVSGDLSLAQINTEVWNKEFNRLGLDQLNRKKLVKDEAYALGKMAIILNIIKARHSKKDVRWFARYHSHTKKFKDLYSVKVEKRMRMIASVN